MIDIVVSVIVVAIIGGAVAYIIKSKKSGQKCIGCPGGCSCSCDASCSTCTSCGGCEH